MLPLSGLLSVIVCMHHVFPSVALPVVANDLLASSDLLKNGQDAQRLNAQFATLTANDSCSAGQNACVNGQFAQCINGAWSLTACSGGSQCFALPLVKSRGTSVACDTRSDALARIAATKASGGLIGAASGNGNSTGSTPVDKHAMETSASSKLLGSPSPAAPRRRQSFSPGMQQQQPTSSLSEPFALTPTSSASSFGLPESLPSGPSVDSLSASPSVQATPSSGVENPPISANSSTSTTSSAPGVSENPVSAGGNSSIQTVTVTSILTVGTVTVTTAATGNTLPTGTGGQQVNGTPTTSLSSSTAVIPNAGETTSAFASNPGSAASTLSVPSSGLSIPPYSSATALQPNITTGTDAAISASATTTAAGALTTNFSSIIQPSTGFTSSVPAASDAGELTSSSSSSTGGTPAQSISPTDEPLFSSVPAVTTSSVDNGTLGGSVTASTLTPTPTPTPIPTPLLPLSSSFSDSSSASLLFSPSDISDLLTATIS